jgi:hypothetical protein
MWRSVCLRLRQVCHTFPTFEEMSVGLKRPPEAFAPSPAGVLFSCFFETFNRSIRSISRIPLQKQVLMQLSHIGFLIQNVI